MKAIGYGAAKLYGIKQGLFSVVICAPDRKTAMQAFDLFIENANLSDVSMNVLRQSRRHVKIAKTLNNRPLFWAQVDVEAV